MIVTLGVLLVTSLLVTAAFTASEGEIHLSATDTAQKKAYYAAQAGISDYAYHLSLDQKYVEYCLNVHGPNGPSEPEPNGSLNQVNKPHTTEPLTLSELTKARVARGNGVTAQEEKEEEYAIQLLPAQGHTECNSTDAASMIENAAPLIGTFRIASTGFSGNEVRTIVATFAPRSFGDFVYYSEYETVDPYNHYKHLGKEWSERQKCEAFYETRPSFCRNTFFVSGDRILGAIHTEDEVGVCGEPIVFGSSLSDRIEFGHNPAPSDPGYSNEGQWGVCEAGKNNPEVRGTSIPGAEVPWIQLHTDVAALAQYAPFTYQYAEKTEIILQGDHMEVIKHKGNPETEEKLTNVAIPPTTGVIYVSAGACKEYDSFGPVPSYKRDTKCGDVYVHGNYAESLTIVAAEDIVINGPITTDTAGGNATLGLIANNFVRIYHPLEHPRDEYEDYCGVTGKYGDENAEGTLPELHIDAAIEAVTGSFIVDNYDCGEKLGTLHVYGSISQKFAGPVGADLEPANMKSEKGTPCNGGGLMRICGGYTSKEYVYDPRLSLGGPPHFQLPVQNGWYIQRETLAPTP